MGNVCSCRSADVPQNDLPNRSVYPNIIEISHKILQNTNNTPKKLMPYESPASSFFKNGSKKDIHYCRSSIDMALSELQIDGNQRIDNLTSNCSANFLNNLAKYKKIVEEIKLKELFIEMQDI